MPISLPINGTTFSRSFLGGDGTIEISTPGQVWETVFANGGFFTKDMTKLADIKFNIATTALQFGDPGGVKLGVSVVAAAEHEIQLFFNSADPIVLGYGLQNLLTDGKLLVRAQFTANADVTATGSFPAGPLSGTFGVKTGGNVLYERVALFNLTQSAATILRDLFAGIRLPQQVDNVDGIPGPGEVLVNRFGGYLKLNGQLSWGYEIKGTRAFEVPSDLHLALDYDLRLLAGLSVGYQIAGDFSIEARRGSVPNFVRFVVRKHRGTQFNLAADFSANLDLEVTGLQDLTADEFLEKLVGAGVIPVLHVLQDINRFDSLDKLQAEAGKLTFGLIQDLAQNLNFVLNNQTFVTFIARVHSIVDLYNRAGDKLTNLLKDALTRFPETKTIIDLLAGAVSRQDLQVLVNRTDLPPVIANKLLDFIVKVWNEKIFDLFLKNAEFAEFQKFILKAKGLLDNPGELKTLIDTVEAFNPFNNIFKTLEDIKTPQDLANLGELKLQGLVEKLLGKGFDEIRKQSVVVQAFNDLQTVMSKIENFKTTWFAKLQAAAQQSFAFSLHAEYARASDNTELLDVEVDVSQDAGRRLARMAASGDFRELLDNFQSNMVRINQGVFTHNTSQSTHITINLLGVGKGLFIDSLFSLLQSAEEAIEPQPGGLLHVYSTDTALQETRQSRQEKIQSNFLLRTVSESFQPEGQRNAYVLATLKSMGIQYTLSEENKQMKTERLTRYLEMAEFLKLIPSAQAYMEELEKQVGPQVDSVSAKYSVGYDDATVRAAFIQGETTLRNLGRQACRELISAHYTRGGPVANPFEGRIAFAYLSNQVANAFFTSGNPEEFVHLTIQPVEPAWYTGDQDEQVTLAENEKRIVAMLFMTERNYLNQLVKLSQQVKANQVDPKALDDASKAFLEKGKGIDKIQPNGFFCIFDRVAREGAEIAKLPGFRRNSALILQATATLNGNQVSVNKILMEPNPDRGAAGSPDPPAIP